MICGVPPLITADAELANMALTVCALVVVIVVDDDVPPLAPLLVDVVVDAPVADVEPDAELC